MHDQNYTSNAPGPVQHLWSVPIPTKNTLLDAPAIIPFCFAAPPQRQSISPTIGNRLWLLFLASFCFDLKLPDFAFAQVGSFCFQQPILWYHPILAQGPEPPAHWWRLPSLSQQQFQCSASFLANVLNSNNSKSYDWGRHFDYLLFHLPTLPQWPLPLLWPSSATAFPALYFPTNYIVFCQNFI